MFIVYIIYALGIGFVAAIPLGPVNVFVVSQTLKHNFLRGFLAGLTTSFMDALYCLIALVGLTHISINLKPYQPYMKGVSFLILAGLGIQLIRQSKMALVNNNQENNLIRSSRPIFGVFLLYIANPTIYAWWIAIAGMATGHGWVIGARWQPVAFSVACGVGSMLWYLLLVRYISRHQHKIRPAAFQKLLLFLGIALIAFGIYTLMTIFYPGGSLPHVGTLNQAVHAR